jgi:hypothetical protein
MKTYNIVTTKLILKSIKASSKYFKTDLGYSVTTESASEGRTFNKKDEFAYFYNKTFRSSPMLEGNIGNIRIYTEHNILPNKVVFFFKNEDFVFDFEEDVYKQKGVDFLLGKYIKTMETQFADRLRAQEEEQNKQSSEPKKKGDPNKVLTNPGNVTYEDLMAYMEKQRLERLKV